MICFSRSHRGKVCIAIPRSLAAAPILINLLICADRIKCVDLCKQLLTLPDFLLKKRGEKIARYLKPFVFRSASKRRWKISLQVRAACSDEDFHVDFTVLDHNDASLKPASAGAGSVCVILIVVNQAKETPF